MLERRGRGPGPAECLGAYSGFLRGSIPVAPKYTLIETRAQTRGIAPHLPASYEEQTNGRPAER